MQTDEFSEGLQDLIAITKKGVSAIMCAEAVPWRCHRRMITDALIVARVEVSDIMSISSVRPAKVNEFARVENERITYPAPG